jgi:guanylate kinase
MQSVLDQGKNVILDIDMKGVLQLQTFSQFTQRPVYIFVAPPSFHELERRLKARGTEDAESLAARLDAAREELQWGYGDRNVDHLIVNADLHKAYGELKRAIFGERVPAPHASSNK